MKFIEIELTELEIDEIRDKCLEKLQIVGFDSNYELTAIGELLEELIDKLFIK